jgi:hypothetical protein
MTYKSRINIKKQTKNNPDVQYETYREKYDSIQFNSIRLLRCLTTAEELITGKH